MNKKIVLITINSKTRLYSITEEDYSAVQPNIYMELLKSYLESKNFEVITLDETLGLSLIQYSEIIYKINPYLVGVVCAGANPSSSTMSMVGAINFFKEFNDDKKDIVTFICGGHPSVLPQRTLDETNADFVIRGEGYETIVELYNALVNETPLEQVKGLAYYYFSEGCTKGDYVDTGFADLVDVNILPQVNWQGMNPHKYKAHNWHSFEDINNRSPYGVIWTSFGCPYSCSFCCINNLFGKRSYRLRNIDSVLVEIDELVLKYNVKNIKIMDELFVINHSRMEEFYQGLKKRNYNLNIWAYARMDSVNEKLLMKLKEVGLKWIAYGIESVSQHTLNDISKGYDQNFYDKVIKMTQDVGMYICADIIAGLWEDTEESLQQTYDWCVSKNFEWLNIYPLFAYPGTDQYAQFIKNGDMKVPKDWESYALYGRKCHPMKNKTMSAAEILRWRDNKFLEYHSRPEYLDMLERKFSLNTRKHIEEMTKKILPRELLGD